MDAIGRPHAPLSRSDRARPSGDRNGATRRRYAGPMSGGSALRKTAAGTGTDPKTAFAWRRGPAGVVEADGRCFPLSSGAGGGTCPGSRGREVCGRKSGGYRREKCVSPPLWTAGGPARTPVRAGVGGRDGFRPVPPPDRLFLAISPPPFGSVSGPSGAPRGAVPDSGTLQLWN